MIYSVAIPSPLRRFFDYLPPNEMAHDILPGMRVSVPFGHQTLIGLVIATKTHSDQPADKLKAIDSLIDETPLINGDMLDLYLWAASYYQHPPGDALLSILPTLARKGQPLPNNRHEHWQLTSHGLGLGENPLPRAKKQQQLLLWLRANSPSPTTDILAQGFTRAQLKNLADKGLAKAVALPTKQVTADKPLLAEAHLALRAEQQQALAAIDFEGFNSYLLFGDTGTGKTEVYLQAIEGVLARGRQALVLVPEINLTPQTLGRFQRRFNCAIAALHSGMNDKARLQSWADARSGAARIVIGTRSAIFTPLAQPGMIILDEEHDPSFKQQDGFRYSARDVAVMRARRENTPVILGSATPALESLYNCERGRYQLLHLRDRGQTLPPPAWQLLDLRGTDLKAGFSAPLLQAMAAELAQGHQVLVFLNRRGYAPLLMCHDCGWQAQCQHCSARLTTHLSQKRLICHHCEARQPIPRQCPQCHSPNIQFMGQGTERSEEVLREFFPGTRIIRLDRDSTRRRDAMGAAIAEIRRNQPCILLGTQMIAKGHHFPAVTLAALLEVDNGLFSPDFRATERMAQMITQVAGRAGRGEMPGKVIIQSHYVDHPLLLELVAGDYRRFAQLLLAERRLQMLPPYINMAVIRAEASQATSAEAFLTLARQQLETLLPPSPDTRYLGPLPAHLEKRQGFHRFTLAIFTANRPQLGTALQPVCLVLEQNPAAKGVRWGVDVDPLETN